MHEWPKTQKLLSIKEKIDLQIKRRYHNCRERHMPERGEIWRGQ